MSSKITSEHLCRAAAVYIRQSTLTQVLENTESQRRQYELVEAARAAGFASVMVIDDDLGRSGSGRRGTPWVPEACSRGVRRNRRSGVLHRGFAPRSKRTRLAPSDRPVRSGRCSGCRPGRGLRSALD